jgi:predicted small integral membrane protein
VPTSVLLAVLAAAGLLALAPALTRRYDATERLVAERAASTARVLSRQRRRRTVPGRRPVNPPRAAGTANREASVVASQTASVVASGARRGRSGGRSGGKRFRSAMTVTRRTAPGAITRRRRAPSALHRRRRVFLVLVLLNVIEMAGVALVGTGFWTGLVASFVLLLADLVYLRRQAVLARRARRAAARRARRIARQQAAVRREHARRAAERREAARRAAAEREEARREAVRHAREYVERYGPRQATGTADALPALPRSDAGIAADATAGRHPGLRGRPYEMGR